MTYESTHSDPEWDLESLGLEHSAWQTQEEQESAQEAALAQAERDDAQREHALAIAKMRAIADFFEANPQLDVPSQNQSVSVWVWGKEEMAKWAKALPGKKDKDQSGTTYYLRGKLPVWAAELYYPSIELVEPVTVTISSSRETICERVVTGKEFKEVKVYPPSTTEMQEVEIVEWRCTDSLLAPSDTE